MKGILRLHCFKHFLHISHSTPTVQTSSINRSVGVKNVTGVNGQLITPKKPTAASPNNSPNKAEESFFGQRATIASTSLCMSVCLSVCLSIRLSLYLFVSLPVCLTSRLHILLENNLNESFAGIKNEISSFFQNDQQDH